MKWIVVTLASLVFAPLWNFAEDLPDKAAILAKHMEAKGGRAAWDAVQSLKISGSYTGFSIPGPFTMLKKQPGQVFFDHMLGGKRVIIATDGQVSWWVNPWFDLVWPTLLPAADQAVLERHRDFATPFFDLDREGHLLADVSMDEFEGERLIKLVLQRRDGSEETWYLDPATHLEYARISPGSDFGAPMDQTSFFSDFRETGGLLIPHLVETHFGTRHRVMEIEAVAVNPVIEDARFRMPLPEGMSALQNMVGKWAVTVEQRNGAGAAWRATETTAEITAHVRGGLVREHIQYVEGSNPPRTLVRNWSYDRFRGRYRMTQIDDYSFFINVFEGVAKEGAITVDNLVTGLAWPAYGGAITERYSIKELRENGFVLERELSRDDGASWLFNLRFTYQRQTR